MKVIDLLNKIANGEEVPKYIKVYNDIYEYDNFNKLYWNSNNKHLLDVYNGKILNYEVEIIEEEKKIPEKITMRAGLVGDINNKIENLDINIMTVEDKLNEIIDYLKSKGDE